MAKMLEMFKTDRLIASITGVGVPAFMIGYTISKTGITGDYKLSMALYKIGFGGIATGIFVLLVVEIVVYCLVSGIIEQIYIRRIHRLIDEGVSNDMIAATLKSQNISKFLKLTLIAEAVEYSSLNAL